MNAISIFLPGSIEVYNPASSISIHSYSIWNIGSRYIFPPTKYRLPNCGLLIDRYTAVWCINTNTIMSPK